MSLDHAHDTAGSAGRTRAALLRVLLLAGLVTALPLLLLWATGGLGVIAQWAAEGQRTAQNALAGAIRQTRGGQAGAFAALLGVAFAYGVFHAAGPGHGKVLIGGYGVARRVRLAPLVALALASSLAQAAVAVALVHGAVAALGWTRERILGAAEGTLLPLSHLGVALIGLYLCWRGLRGVLRAARARAHDHNHDHDHDHACDHCGHRHGVTPEEVSAVTGWREALALVVGVAMRPCTGALLLLVLTWQMGIAWAGIAGAFAMGLGTAAITIAVAMLSVWSREGMLAALSQGRVARALPWLELAAGALIATVSALLPRASL